MLSEVSGDLHAVDIDTRAWHEQGGEPRGDAAASGRRGSRCTIDGSAPNSSAFACDRLLDGVSLHSIGVALALNDVCHPRSAVMPL